MTTIEARRTQWHKEEAAWIFVLETYCQHDYKRIVEILTEAGSLSRAVDMAQSERGGAYE